MSDSALRRPLAPLIPPLHADVGGRARAETLIEAAQSAERRGRRDEARAYYEQAIRSLGTEEHGLAASLLRWIGVTHQQDADSEAAVDCFRAALASAEASGDEAGIGHAVNALATSHFHQGELDAAEGLFLQARESARRSGDAKLSAMTSQNLGIIANIRGELEGALAHYEASLADYRALGLPKYLCMTLNNLGLLYTRMERWETAERAFDEAVRMSQVLGDITTRILIEVNRAALWTTRADYGRAREACDLAVELSRQTRDTRAIGEAHKQYGIIARETGQLERAEEALLRASRLADERQDLLLAAETAREMAELYHRMGRSRDTLHCLNRAHRLFSQLHARPALADIDRQMARLESDFEAVVRRWGESIESQDRYTKGHCDRVAALACALYHEAKLDPKQLFWFRLGALLHDVGKLSVPASVLNKPGRLTSEEWALVRQHPTVGVRMLADVDFPYDVRPIVESHHERWDGEGYPTGLKGEAIPLEARILCVADVYDALTSERSYKKPVSHAQAMEMMRAEAGAQFDPALFAHFEELMRRSPQLWAGHVEAPEPAVAPPAAEGAGEQDTLTEIDHLTGALLRRAFTVAADNVLSRLRATEQAPSLLVIDIDHFKLVNDTYGHLTGDDVLRMVVQTLRRTLRTADIVGRYGGDELVVLLPRTTIERAREVAERVRAAVEADRCAARDRESVLIGVTLSIGVAGAEPGDHPEALFAAADRALYEAKRGGRNGVSVAHGAQTPTTPQLLLSRFVGRQQEMRRLVALLDDAAARRPRVVAAVGEAGIGKSTLIKQLFPEARLRGAAMVVGRCAEADVKAPYAPWAEILSTLAGQPGAPAAAGWRELPRLVPALEASDPTGVAAPSGSKYALFDEITEYLRRAAASHPLVLVLDDMQWADAATWDTLEHLVAELSDEPILIALTIRSEDAGSEVTKRRRRLSRDERFHELALTRLSAAEVAAWLTAASNGADLGRDLLPTLYRHTEGNPFLVMQVLRTLVEEGELRFEHGRWHWHETPSLRLPVAVSDLMARRLDRLSPRTRSILTTTAVIGRVFHVDLALAAGAGTEEELLDALDEAVTAAVLEPSRQHRDVYSFSHSLLVDAIRSTANPRRLARIHEAVARALVQRSPGSTGEIALHYDAADVAAEAYRYAMDAGSAATAVYAHEDAAKFFALAQRRAESARDRLDAALGLLQVLEAAARYGDAEALCDAAIADARDEPGTQLRLRCLRERLRMLQGAPVQETLAACQALGLEVESAGAEVERATLLAVMSQAHARGGDLPEAERLARRFVETAKRIGDERLLADALTRLGSTLTNQRKTEAIALYERAEAVFRRLGDLNGLTRCRINVGVTHILEGESGQAEQAYHEAVALGREAHAPDLTGLASLNLGVLYMRDGRFDEAHERFEEARRLFTTVRNASHRLAALVNLGHLARERGEPEQAIEVYAQAVDLAQRIGQLDVELAALAGGGLSALHVARGEMAEQAAARVVSLLADRDDWWFQGRELAEALCVNTLLAAGDVAGAFRRFDDAMALLGDGRDRSGAAWLVAELARPLTAVGRADVSTLVARHADEVRTIGHARLTARYRSLLERPASLTPEAGVPTARIATPH